MLHFGMGEGVCSGGEDAQITGWESRTHIEEVKDNLHGSIA